MHARQQGAILLMVLLFVLVSAIGATTLVEVQATQARREREEQLLFVGDQYRRAIQSYANVIPPGGARALPSTIDDLLQDHRFPTPIQHLRKAYPDPMTGRADWELVLRADRIAGVRSSSLQEPIKKAGFPERYRAFENQAKYNDWVFAADLR